MMKKTSSSPRAKSALKEAFEKKAKPVFTFKSAVAEAYEMFPELKGSVFFIDLKTNKAVHSDPAIRKTLVDFVNANDDVRIEINKGKFNALQKRSSVCMFIEGDDFSLPFVTLYLEKDMMNVLKTDHPLSESRFCVFDHEFAHAMIPEAKGGDLCHEMVADAYMALRHFQRFGDDSKTIDLMMKRRAALAFFNQDPEHFTSPALKKVLEFNEKYDLLNITPAQTARLAAYIGKKSMIDHKAYKSLSRQFNKLKGKIETVEDDKALRDFAGMVLRARSPEMKKWGPVALSAFTEGKLHLKKDADENGRSQPVVLRGKYWDDVRAKIAPR